MAGIGRRYKFHGAFKFKPRAARRESRREGAFIREVSMHGQRRYLVMSPKRK